jgi:methyl-accepting chemotaxis protein
MKNLSVLTKLLLLIVVAAVGMTLLGAFALFELKGTMLEEREMKTRHVVESAYGVLEYYYAQQQSGKLSESDARLAARDTIKFLRYEMNGYFWINDLHSRMVMHPMKPELDGKDLSEMKDPTGKRIFVEFAEVANRSGAGFVSYMWPKPDASQPMPKISYVKEFNPWEWVIGSGVYIDDIDAAFRVTALKIAAIILTLSAGIGLYIYYVARAITIPLAEGVNVAGKIASGDLTSNIEITSNDELGTLLTSFKVMQGSILGLIGEIKASTDTISTASKQIAAGNNDLSQRTEEQASSLEETASSMEELTSTVRQNTENAKQANQLAISASDVAGKGGDVVSKVVVTMDSINESSRKIVDIISVIDGIAFQTNILALNAAVEAARAGEQGRGFAVVAGEVRNLAQRSAAAAKEIKALIGDSVEKVEGGSKLVAQAGQTMEEIVISIRRVTDIVSEITAASVEQSQGIEQVNAAITQMDDVTQQNAALVEEAAAAAESMEEQAQILSASVANFKVDNGASPLAQRAPGVARQASAPEHKALAGPSHKTFAKHKLGHERKTDAKKWSAVVTQKPKSGEEDDWKEF